MPAAANHKPYLDAWLKRTGKELSASGRLSELVMILATRNGSDSQEWRERLRRILDKEDEPGFELLTEIDTILARPARVASIDNKEADLFG